MNKYVYTQLYLCRHLSTYMCIDEHMSNITDTSVCSAIELIYKKHWLLSLKIRNYVLCIMLVVSVQIILQLLSYL